MDSKTISIKPGNQAFRRRRAAFTLVEILVATAVAALCAAALASMLTFATRSFQSLFNYEGLHADNRVAVDHLTRDIRQANRVTACSTNSLTLEDADGVSLTYAFNPVTRKFTRTKGTDSKVILTDCKALTFRLGERNPIGGSYDVYPAATIATAKVVDVAWTCSRTILGVEANTESVQTARIVIRKQGT